MFDVCQNRITTTRQCFIFILTYSDNIYANILMDVFHNTRHFKTNLIKLDIFCQGTKSGVFLRSHIPDIGVLKGSSGSHV